MSAVKNSADKILAEVYKNLERNHNAKLSLSNLLPDETPPTSSYGPHEEPVPSKKHKKKKKRKDHVDKIHRKSHKSKKTSKISAESDGKVSKKHKKSKKSKKSGKKRLEIEESADKPGDAQLCCQKDEVLRQTPNFVEESPKKTGVLKVALETDQNSHENQSRVVAVEEQVKLLPKSEEKIEMVRLTSELQKNPPSTTAANEPAKTAFCDEFLEIKDQAVKVEEDHPTIGSKSDNVIKSTNSDTSKLPVLGLKSKSTRRLVIGLSEKTKIFLAEKQAAPTKRRPIARIEDGEILRSDNSSSDEKSLSIDGADDDDGEEGAADGELPDDNDEPLDHKIYDKFRPTKSSHGNLRSRGGDKDRRRSTSKSPSESLRGSDGQAYVAERRRRSSPTTTTIGQSAWHRRRSTSSSRRRRRNFLSTGENCGRRSRSTSRDHRRRFGSPPLRHPQRIGSAARRRSRSPLASTSHGRFYSAGQGRRGLANDYRRAPMTPRVRRWRLGDDDGSRKAAGGRTPSPRRRQYYKRDRSRSNSRHRQDNVPSKKYARREKWCLGRSPESCASLLGIDKAELLAIAKRNASAMLQQGTLQKICSMSSDEIAKLKAGGTSVDELVEYCQKLQKKQMKLEERRKEMARSGSDSDSSSGSKVSSGAKIHHPFALNPSKPSNIVFNIKNVHQLPNKTPAERALDEGNLRLTFPVSSGQQHRTKESEWVPVSPPRPAPTPVVAEKRPRLLEAKPLPPPPAPPPLPPASTRAIASELASATGATFTAGVADDGSQPSTSGAPTATSCDAVFGSSTSQAPMDIGEVVANRLKAIKRLYENPNDSEALQMMHYAEQMMRKWAESKNVPGAFQGGTGVQCLTPDQLAPNDPKFQAWARKDQLLSSKPLQSGVGMTLLQKMGWKPGEGLGKNKEGALKPLLLDIKNDRKGLVANEELLKNKPQSLLTIKVSGPGVSQGGMTSQTFSKHPVSALMELCSKRRWHPPSFTYLEQGPSHSRRFIWKVLVNGVEYQPAVPCANKKQAKLQAAQVAIQSLGLAPLDPSLPIVIG